MDTTKIVKAARAEYGAEQKRDASDALWRSRWHDTTLLLAEPVGKTEAAEVLAVAVDELGQSRKWLDSRRRTGKIIKSALAGELVDLEEVRSWMPRLAVAWVVDLRRDENGMAEALRVAVKEEQSLREFIAAHGGVPMSTGRERFTPTPPPAPAPRTHQEKVTVAREALADPEVAKEVMRDTPTAINAHRASRDAAAEQHGARRRDRALEDPAADRERAESDKRMRVINIKLELDGFIRHAKGDLTSAISRWNEIGSQFDSQTLLLDIDDMLNVANALRSAVASGRTLEAELQAFLAAEGGA